jgi:hypothetical protein
MYGLLALLLSTSVAFAQQQANPSQAAIVACQIAAQLAQQIERDTQTIEALNKQIQTLQEKVNAEHK